ncbi:MAG: hypothetical protein H0U70_02920 [Tatlockia sp.]|nr:hypothetical protein [Tatlockia sp.]
MAKLARQYLSAFYQRNCIALLSSLVPILLVTWKGAKLIGRKPKVKKVAKSSLLTLFNLLRNINKFS